MKRVWEERGEQMRTERRKVKSHEEKCDERRWRGENNKGEEGKSMKKLKW